MDIPFVGFKHAKRQLELLSLDSFYQRGLDYSPRPDTLHRVGFHCLFRSRAPGTHRIDFALHPYQAGDLVYIAPGQVHAYDFSTPMSGDLLLMTEEYYRRLRVFLPLDCLKLLRQHPVTKLDTKETEIIGQLMSLILSQQQYDSPELNRQLTSANLLLSLTQGRQAGEMEPALELQYQQLLGLVQSHLADTRNAIDYCRLMAMGFTKLNGICVKVSGYTLKRVIDNQVVLEAKRLLATEPMNINQLSDRLGFDETTNFSKYFKKHTGCTPRQFRDRWRQDLPLSNKL
ncbi:helix-turn-helix domain-containing protein [Shewanella sp. GXUN23E]|uniref:helix-turn-helix domain-containing protein n=1 Tax=Shewanella sp. GXUN23E TaxID=3422498 RepID=UPI003D7D70FA